MWPFRSQPRGYSLEMINGGIPQRIRADQLPADILVINSRGRAFVRTGEKDSVGFEVYREGYRTHEHVSHGE